MVTIVVPRGFRSDRRLALPRVLTPLYVKTRVFSGLGDGLACVEVCHDALGDLSRKEAFTASDDLAFGPAIGGASGDVVAGWLVESHADDDGSIEGGVRWLPRWRRCRPVVLPDEAGIGHAPQSFAQAASERIRSG